ncbi:MAG: prepilin peptidase [Pirellulales bacterium]|nr:prepilin peptidase [Pirellulales bacterium]
MVVTVLLLTLLAVAAATDISRHKIYNWTTYPGMLAALGLNGLGSLLARFDLADGPSLESLGWIGVVPSLVGLLVCGFVLLVCYVLLRVGGGDVKLMAMLGAFLGPEKGVEAMLWTFVLGGCMAVILLIWRVGPWPLLVRFARHALRSLRLGRPSPLSEEDRAELQPPLFLAPSAMVAVVIVRFGLIGPG